MTSPPPPPESPPAPAVPARPWEQQPGESDLAYARFLLYLHTPAENRQVAATARKIIASAAREGKTLTLPSLTTLASRRKWADRAAAYDRQINAEIAESHRDARERVIREHLALAATIRARVAAEFAEGAAGQAGHSDLARWLDLAVRMERQSLDLDAPRRVEHTGPGGQPIAVDVSGLPPAERAAELAALAAQAAARAELLARAADDDAD